jgi:hypothetical protein
MKHSPTLGEIGKALAAAQKTIQPALKDTLGQVGNVKKPYADIQSVWQACRQSLTEHGLSIVQVPAANGNAVTVTTLLLHSSGEWISGELTMTAAKNDPQSIGSAITYARRYSLSAMVSVAPGDDDDGHAGTHSRDHREPEPTPVSRDTGVPAPPPAAPVNPDKTVLIQILKQCDCQPKPATDALDVCRYVATLYEQPQPASMDEVWARSGEFCTNVTNAILKIHDQRQCSPDDAAVILRDEARADAAARNEVAA